MGIVLTCFSYQERGLIVSRDYVFTTVTDPILAKDTTEGWINEKERV